MRVEERQRIALNYRRQGASLREIALKLGVSHTQIAKDINKALAPVREEIQKGGEDLVAIEAERLDGLLTALAPKIAKGDVAAIDTARKISESKRRLLGTDQPVKVAPTSPDGKKPYEPLDPAKYRDMDGNELFQRYRQATADAGAAERKSRKSGRRT